MPDPYVPTPNDPYVPAVGVDTAANDYRIMRVDRNGGAFLADTVQAQIDRIEAMIPKPIGPLSVEVMQANGVVSLVKPEVVRRFRGEDGTVLTVGRIPGGYTLDVDMLVKACHLELSDEFARQLAAALTGTDGSHG